MAYPSTQLISQAYWVSGIRGHDFQAISGPDLGYGLNVLNDLIGDLRVESDMIPYTSTSYSFNLVIGQQEYFIPNLTVCDTLTFFIDTVRYAMQEVPRTTFFGSSRVNGLQSLPLSYHTERALGGLNVFVYFYPDQTYPMELVGLFAPSPVTANQDLSLVWDQYFINYFKYALAERLCTEYNITTPPGVTMQLNRYQMQIAKISTAPDLTMQSISTFNNSRSINYGQVNIGRGFTTFSRF